MLAAIIPWHQQALLCFVRASLYQGSVLIRNGGRDAEQVGLAAEAGCSQGLSHQPSQPLAGAVGALWGGFWGSVRNPCFVQQATHTVLFFSFLFSVKIVPAGSFFPAQHCVMPEGPGMSQPWCAQLPFLRAEGWRRSLAQTNRPSIKTSWVLHWVGTTTGEYQWYQELSQSSKSHRRDLCPSWIPCYRGRCMWKALQPPAPGALLPLWYSKDSTH